MQPDIIEAARGLIAAKRYRAARRLLASRPDLPPVGLALLDQRLVSGIGNIYRCETLLLAGIDPHRPIGEVEDVAGLMLLARDRGLIDA